MFFKSKKEREDMTNRFKECQEAYEETLKDIAYGVAASTAATKAMTISIGGGGGAGGTAISSGSLMSHAVPTRAVTFAGTYAGVDLHYLETLLELSEKYQMTIPDVLSFLEKVLEIKREQEENEARPF